MTPITNRSDPNYYPLSVALDQTADFVSISDDPSTLPQIRFKRQISWPNGKPPPDEPVCGFYYERCDRNAALRLTIIILSIVIILSMLISAPFIYVYKYISYFHLRTSIIAFIACSDSKLKNIHSVQCWILIELNLFTLEIENLSANCQ